MKNESPPPSLNQAATQLLKQHFFAGVLVVIPLGIISWILFSVLGYLWQLHEILPEHWRPESFIHRPEWVFLFNLGITLTATLVLALGVSLLGWISKQYLGIKALQIVEYLIQQIPVIRGVYSALDQLLKTVSASGSQQFNRVVYVEYPRKGSWTLAFVTGEAHLPHLSDRSLNLYVPTTPNPTSGFYLIVPEKEIIDAQLSVEDAFKVILSLGIAQPLPKSGTKKESH